MKFVYEKKHPHLRKPRLNGSRYVSRHMIKRGFLFLNVKSEPAQTTHESSIGSEMLYMSV